MSGASMKTDEIIGAARACARKILEISEEMGVDPPPHVRLPDLTKVPWRARDGHGHLLFMCDEIERFVNEAVPHGYAAAAESLKIESRTLIREWIAYANKREKAMRWLGFVQGTLWGWGLATIEELKQMNAPTGASE